LRQQQNATVLAQPPAVERRRHFLGANRWEREAQRAFINHRGGGTFCPDEKNGVNTYSLHQIKQLSYVRHPDNPGPVNKTG